MRKSKHVKIIIIVLIVVCIIGYKFHINSQRDASYYDSNILSGYIDCNENKIAVPGDALYYCEYYYDEDISDKFSENYKLITAKNISKAETYLKIFNQKYLYDDFNGNKNFLGKINEGDYYALRSGCSNEVSEGHFLLHFYDKESKTIYKMWRCQ